MIADFDTLSPTVPREELVILTKCCMVVAKDPTAHPATLTDPDNNGASPPRVPRNRVMLTQ